MIHIGRLPASKAEHKAIDDLIAAHPHESVSLTRRDPREKGPLLVHIGDKTFEVSKAGKTKEL